MLAAENEALCPNESFTAAVGRSGAMEVDEQMRLLYRMIVACMRGDNIAHQCWRNRAPAAMIRRQSVSSLLVNVHYSQSHDKLHSLGIPSPFLMITA